MSHTSHAVGQRVRFDKHTRKLQRVDSLRKSGRAFARAHEQRALGSVAHCIYAVTLLAMISGTHHRPNVVVAVVAVVVGGCFVVVVVVGVCIASRPTSVGIVAAAAVARASLWAKGSCARIKWQYVRMLCTHALSWCLTKRTGRNAVHCATMRRVNIEARTHND